MKQIIILAGNYGQFKECVSHFSTPLQNKCIYGSSPEKIYGFEVGEIISTGTFWDRKDADRLWEIVQSRVR